MALIQVTSATLRNQASELRSLNESLKTQVSNLESVEMELASMWTGDAKDAFHTAFNSDKGQFDVFYALIEQYIVTLENAATEYDNKEATNTSIANTRTY
jgi:WXG100 family type VII secretion target